ncbi:MAG: AraC family transcriptional regulator [Bdellovibrionota bacterium]
MTLWPKRAPRGTVEIKPPSDLYLTLERWPKEAFDVHYHDAFNWLVPMRPGTLTVRIGKEEFRVDGNQWLCIFPNTPHEVKAVSDGIEVMSLFFSHEEMKAALGRTVPRAEEPYILGGKGTIAQGLALQWAESRLPESDASRLRAAFTKFICGWLWSFYGKNHPVENTPELLLKLKMDALAAKIGLFMEDHLSESSFPWEELAGNLGMSFRTLQRTFAQKLNLSPSELLTAWRVEFCKRELRDPDVELADVALKAGFSSQSHFSTIFKTHTGHSPTQFRAQIARIGIS